MLEDRAISGDAPAPRRLNGDRYVTGSVRYLGDFVESGQLHIAFLRSPHSHALIESIDVTKARNAPGVRAVMTGEDLTASMGHLVCRIPIALTKTKVSLSIPCLPTRHVRYHGEPLALVVAESELAARRASSLIEVNYEVLEPMLDVESATAPGACLQHAMLPSNVVMASAVVEGDPAALESADRIFEGRVSIGRSSAVPLETRGCIAAWSKETQRLVVKAAVQQPHGLRASLAAQLGLPESDIQVITPALGGAFGFKFIGLAEEPLTCLMALVLKQPVRWIESRAEALTVGAREYEMFYRIGVDAGARISALHVRFDANIGALCATPGPVMPIVAATTFPGPYHVPNLSVQWRAVMTNKGPWNGARGFGKEATCLLLETALDHVARALNLDPAEVRRRNLLRPEQFPHRTTTMTIDSGDYQRALDMVLSLSGYAQKREQQRASLERSQARAIGERTSKGLGIGFELTPESSDAAGTLARGFETATVRIDTSGYCTVLTGVTSPGTGSETAIAQMVASELGMPAHHVRVIQGDTDATPYGSGSFSSRAVLVGGTAAWLAARDLRRKLVTTAAVLMNVDESEIAVGEGRYCVVREPARAITLGRLALALRTLGSAMPGISEPQLEATRTYGPENLQSIPDEAGRMQIYPTYSYSVHVAEVEVDMDTGVTRLINLSAVHDCGTVINQDLVDAQLHGAIAMGVGMALTEEERYDKKGRPIDRSFKTYLLPLIKDLPSIRVGHLASRSPFTTLGIKGAGESGVGGSAAAVANAIRDALGDADAVAVALPKTPARVLARIDQVARVRP